MSRERGGAANRRSAKFLIVLTLCLFIITPITSVGRAAAAERDVYVAAAAITAKIPDGYIYFTRDTRESDPNLEKLGITLESLLSRYESGSIYLETLPEDNSVDITVTVGENSATRSAGDFRFYTQDGLASYQSDLKKSFEKDGITLSEIGYYSHADAAFITMRCTQDINGYTDYMLRYYTVVGGKGIGVTLHKLTGDITQEEQFSFSRFVDNMGFTDKATQEEVDERLEKNNQTSFGKKHLLFLAGVGIIAVSMIGYAKGRARRKQ